MKKLWSSDDDTDEEEVVKEFPFKNDDPPRYTNHVSYISSLNKRNNRNKIYQIARLCYLNSYLP